MSKIEENRISKNTSDKEGRHLVDTLKRLLQYMSKYKFRLILVAICMVAGSVCSVRAVYYMKPLINDYITPLIGQKNPDYSGFAQVLIRMGLLYLFSVLASLLQGVIMVSISNDVMFLIRKDMFRVMEHLPMSYFDRHNRGQIMSYFSNDVDALSNMLRQSIPRVVEGITGIITILVTIFTVNVKMALVVVISVSVIVLALRLLTGNKSRYYIDQQQCMQEMNDFGEEMISGRTEIKAFSREEKVGTEFAKINERLFENVNKADFFANSMFDFTSGLTNLGFAAVAVSGCLMCFRGMADPGTVGVFLQYYKKLITPVTRIAKQVSNVMEAMAGAERVFYFIDLPLEEDDGNIRLVACHVSADGMLKESDSYSGSYAWKMPSGQLKACRGALRFADVTFGYVEGTPVLKNLDFEVEPGQKIAFVGSTGAGKTTVINLLSRFYEIFSGTIYFDGIDIRDIRKNDLRRAAGIVLQDTHLFGGTVKDNIRYGFAEATDENVREAAKIANADYFISRMKDGYDTRLSQDGGSLSEGERQLLAIARAAVGKNPVLVLDEATSSIDSRTELLVTKGLEALMEGKTVLMIAHRLSTIRGADRIIVLDHGRIVESGNHEKLMAEKGLYYSLYTGTGVTA